MSRSVLGVCIVVLIAACAPGDTQTKGSDPDALRTAETDVNQRFSAYPHAVLSGQIDSILSFWTPDVIALDKGLRVEGAAAQRELAASFFRDHVLTRLTHDVKETVAHDDGSVAYMFASYREDYTPKAGGDTSRVHSNFAARWIKDAAGTWRMQRLIATPAPEQPGAPPTVATVPPANAGTSGTPEAIRSRMQEFATLHLQQDAAGAKAFFAEDVRVVQDGMELNDKAAVAKLIDDFFANQRVAALEVTTDDVFVHDNGTVAYEYGHYTETAEPKAGGAPTVYRNHYLVRWKKSTEGGWLIDRFYTTPMPSTRT